MKKLTTKLMISVLSVALAFIALGTSTFAWFSMNTEVTASGMELTAATPVNLLISPDGTTPELWKNTAESDEGLTGKLYPASSQYGIDFNAIQSNQSVDTEEGDSLGGVVDTTGPNTGVKFQPTATVTAAKLTDSTDEGYYAVYDYYLKLSEAVDNTYAYLASLSVIASKTLAVGTVVTGSEGYYTDEECTTALEASTLASATKVYFKNQLANSVRVAVFEGDNDNSANLLGIYAIDGAQDTYKAVKGTMTATPAKETVVAEDLQTMTVLNHASTRTIGGYFNGSTFTAPDFTTAEAGTQYATKTALSSTTAKKITIVVWVEGQDASCVNAAGGVEISVSVTFKAYTATAA